MGNNSKKALNIHLGLSEIQTNFKQITENE